jgi:hypothetical protein
MPTQDDRKTQEDRKPIAAAPVRRKDDPWIVYQLDHAGFGRLLREAGFEVEPAKTSTGKDFYRSQDPAFGAGLAYPSRANPGFFNGFLACCREWLSPPAADVAYRMLRQRLVFATMQRAEDGCLDLMQRAMFLGGVTETHLKEQLIIWREEMKEFRRVVAEVCAQADPRRLH